MLTVTWIKSTSNAWLPLETVDLSGVTVDGVYVIWHAGNPARTVRVGQGNIAARLGAHRLDKAILAYAASGTLYVTWAAVQASQRDGVERFLADHYSPLIGDRHPNVTPIPVNLVA